MAGRALLTRSVLNRLVGDMSQSLPRRHRHRHPLASTFHHVRSFMWYMPLPFRPGEGNPRAVTLIPGDGIGPLVTDAVDQVMDEMDAPIYFEEFNNVRGNMGRLPEEVLDSIRKNKVCLKGPLFSSSLNTQLRKELHLFASLVHCTSVPLEKLSDFPLDITVISDSTEPGDEESFKVIKLCFERIAKYAFDYAYTNNLKKVTAVHKGSSDGLFLESCKKVATNYPMRTKQGWPVIQYSECTVDECCEQLKSGHAIFNVVVTPYIYRDLVANAAADFNGINSIMTEVNVGADHAVFEQVTSAGSNAGNEKLVVEKKANPMGLLLSTALLLRHLHFYSYACELEYAVMGVADVVYHNKYTGEVTTQQVVNEVNDWIETYIRNC